MSAREVRCMEGLESESGTGRNRSPRRRHQKWLALAIVGGTIEVIFHK